MDLPSAYRVEIISTRLTGNDHAASIIECHVIFRGQCKSSMEIKAQSSSDIEINFLADLSMSDFQSEDCDDDWYAVIYITSRPLPGELSGNGYRQLMARAFLDLRLAQVHNGDFLSVEIFHCFDLTDGLESGTAGVLFLKLSSEGSTMTSERSDDLNERIRSSQNQITSEMHQNFQAMRILWAKARKNYPFVENRPLIKLIAEDECGQNRVCCDFIRPIYPPRSSHLANGPRFAARFVSLIPLKRACSLSGGRREQWLPTQAMLLRRSGDVEDHANLLCSLLLGWGMNAFVCSGYIRSSFNSIVPPSIDGHLAGETAIPHYWVVTLDAASSTLFWEPLSGQQFQIPLCRHKVDLDASTRGGHPFLSIAVLFRHDSYLLNVQQNSSLQHCKGLGYSSALGTSTSAANGAASFDICDRKCWAELLPSSSAYAVRLAGADSGMPVRRYTGHPGCHTSLSTSASIGALSSTDILEGSDVTEKELAVEKEIRNMIVSWREDEGLSTMFDEQLSIILQPALFAYEYERVMGTVSTSALSSVDSDFQESIRQYVGNGKGQCFKAYPTCFSSQSSTQHIKKSLAQAAAARDVIFTPQSATTRFALRAKIYPYPSGIYALWVMLSVRFEGPSSLDSN